MFRSKVEHENCDKSLSSLGVQRRLEVSSAGVDESAGGKANSPSSFSSSSSFVCFENFYWNSSRLVMLWET